MTLNPKWKKMEIKIEKGEKRKKGKRK